MCQGGERELVLGVDDQLLAASPRSTPNPSSQSHAEP